MRAALLAHDYVEEIQSPQPTRCVTRQNRGKGELFAVSVIVVALAGLVSGILAASFPLEQADLNRVFAPEHVQLFAMVDNTRARLAYSVWLVSLACVCLMAIILPRRSGASGHSRAVTFQSISERIRGSWGIALLAAAMVVMFGRLEKYVFTEFEEPRLRWGYLFAASVLSVGLMWSAGWWRTRGARTAAWTLLLLYVCALAIPGLLRPISIGKVALLKEAEAHYSLTLGQGDRLAAGLLLGRDVNLNYGLGMTLFTAGFERSVRFLTFGEHIRLVQVVQVVFLLAAVAAFIIWKPHEPFWVLAATAFVGPWVSTSHLAVYYPNQSGWRSLGFPIGVLVLLLARRLPKTQQWLLLGFCSASAVLLNPETGIALSVGFAVFLITQSAMSDGRTRLQLIAHGFVGFAAAGGAALVLFRILLGTWHPLTVEPYLNFLTSFESGYGSLRFYLDPLAFVILTHAAYILVHGFVKLRCTVSPSERRSVRLAVAATILVWGVYYINRPHPWNLWTYLFLYVFLIADLFDSRFLRHSWRAKPFALLDGRIALLALFVLPTLFSSNIHGFLAAVEPRPRTEMAAVSGVLVPRAAAATLLTKARFLASQPKDTVFVTEYSYSLALLTNRFDNLPVQDVFGETITNDQFGRLVAHIQQRKPPVILFDEPQTDLDPAAGYSLSHHQAFFARLRLALSGSYREVAPTHGWRVIKRAISHSNSMDPSP